MEILVPLSNGLSILKIILEKRVWLICSIIFILLLFDQIISITDQLKNFYRDEETALVNELEVRLMEWNAIPAVVDLYLHGAQVNAMDPGQGQFDANVLWLNEKDQVFEDNPKPVKGNALCMSLRATQKVTK